MYSLQYRLQMDHDKYGENDPEAAAPHFLDIGYGPSVACTVGCTWLMYSLCMAHIWPMYDLHMAHILDYIWPYEGLVICDHVLWDRILLYANYYHTLAHVLGGDQICRPTPGSAGRVLNI